MRTDKESFVKRKLGFSIHNKANRIFPVCDRRP